MQPCFRFISYFLSVRQINAFLSFIVPMALISVLNGIIASQLLRMFREAAQDNRVCIVGGNSTMLSVAVEPNRAQSLRHGVMVLREYQRFFKHVSNVDCASKLRLNEIKMMACELDCVHMRFFPTVIQVNIQLKAYRLKDPKLPDAGVCMHVRLPSPSLTNPDWYKW